MTKAANRLQRQSPEGEAQDTELELLRLIRDRLGSQTPLRSDPSGDRPTVSSARGSAPVGSAPGGLERRSPTGLLE